MDKLYSQKSLPETNNKQPQPLQVVYTPQMTDEDDEGGLNLGQLGAAVRRRAIIVAGVTTVVASLALLQSKKSTPIYEAKFQLLTKPVTVESKLVSSVPESLNDSKNQESTTTTGVDDTELRVLQSPKLMDPIIKQIQARYPDSDEPDLDVKVIDKTNILEVSYKDKDPQKVKFVLDTVSKAYLKYSLEERQEDISHGIRFVEAQLPQLQERVQTIQDGLQNFRQRYDVIDPTSQGQQLAVQLNQIVQQRIDTQTQLAKTRSLYATLQSQLELQPTEAVAASALSEATRYQKLLNEMQELESNIATESARYTEDSPTLQNLQEQRRELLPLVEQEAQRVVGNKLSGTGLQPRDLASPNTIRSQEVQQFLDNAKQIRALEAQNQALIQAENSLKEQVKLFPLVARQYNDFDRQLKIAIDNLNQFLTKREALRIEASQKQLPWELLTPPTKPEASVANVKNNLILGVALGLLLGIGAALVVDKFANIFYSLEEVKNTTKLPLLGEIPFKQEHKFDDSKSAKGSKLNQQRNVSQFWESLSSLHTNVRFLSFDRPVRSLAIASAEHGEGKSTIAVHLAQTAAAMGQRVLLVDADLRSPKIHLMLDLPSMQGLSNVIATDLDFKKVIRRVQSISLKAQDYGPHEADPEEIGLPLAGSLSVLTAGPVPPNPASLLSSHRMKKLAEQFQAAFDLVIYDTAPLMGIADTSLLTAYTDGALLVVGLGKTNRSGLEKVLERLKVSSTPVLGVVTNRIKG